jgi:hypothetical protein
MSSPNHEHEHRRRELVGTENDLYAGNARLVLLLSSDRRWYIRTTYWYWLDSGNGEGVGEGNIATAEVSSGSNMM